MVQCYQTLAKLAGKMPFFPLSSPCSHPSSVLLVTFFTTSPIFTESSSPTVLSKSTSTSTSTVQPQMEQKIWFLTQELIQCFTSDTSWHLKPRRHRHNCGKIQESKDMEFNSLNPSPTLYNVQLMVLLYSILLVWEKQARHWLSRQFYLKLVKKW